jgi:hypothetical protein
MRAFAGLRAGASILTDTDTPNLLAGSEFSGREFLRASAGVGFAAAARDGRCGCLARLVASDA